MAVNKKINKEEKIRESESNSTAQMEDIFSQISSLGGGNSRKEETVAESKTESEDETITTVSVSEKDAANDKPGYVSLVIPNSLKKKWKIFSTNHGLSLSDSIKLGMKLMEEMEKNNKIKIDGGFVTFKD